MVVGPQFQAIHQGNGGFRFLVDRSSGLFAQQNHQADTDSGGLKVADSPPERVSVDRENRLDPEIHPPEAEFSQHGASRRGWARGPRGR